MRRNTAPSTPKCEGADPPQGSPDAGKSSLTWQTGTMKSLYENLSEPAPLEEGALRVIPLGGLGEVGRNMNVLEYRGKLLVVDCGVLFPEESQPGVDLILPDFSWIEDAHGRRRGLVLTHGHEDHIGAVPYLLKLRGDIPMYGSDLTLAFVAPKLREHRLADPGLTSSPRATASASAPSTSNSSPSPTRFPTRSRSSCARVRATS